MKSIANVNGHSARPLQLGDQTSGFEGRLTEIPEPATALDRGRPSDLPVLNSLWVGEELSYLERLCLRSALHHGHRFRLYSYCPADLRGVPKGVEVHDAAEVMGRDKLISYAGCANGVALGANLWRYHLLSKGLGFWCDLDFAFMGPLDFPQPYVLGWELEGWINNAMMFAPSDSDFVGDLFALTKPNVRPPWFGPKRSAQFYWKRWRNGYVGLEDLPWGTYSAGLVTHIVKRRRLQQFVVGPSVFYPIRWSEAQMVYGPAQLVNSKLSQDTRAVHLWRSKLGDLISSRPAVGSWIGEQCERYGVEC